MGEKETEQTGNPLDRAFDLFTSWFFQALLPLLEKIAKLNHSSSDKNKRKDFSTENGKAVSAKESTAETVAKLAALLEKIDLDSLPFLKMLPLAEEAYSIYYGQDQLRSRIDTLFATLKSGDKVFDLSYEDLRSFKSDKTFINSLRVLLRSSFKGIQHTTLQILSQTTVDSNTSFNMKYFTNEFSYYLAIFELMQLID